MGQTPRVAERISSPKVFGMDRINWERSYAQHGRLEMSLVLLWLLKV